MTCHLLSIDLDGTLVDTADEIAEAANRALESHGIARRPFDDIVVLIGAGTRELMLRLLARCFIDQPHLVERVRPDAVLESLDEHYAQTTGTTASPYPGCIQMLRDLKAAGVGLACVTNKEIVHARRVLEVTGLSGYFDLVVGGDSLPEKKPHASVLRHVARHFGVDTTHTAHLGDSATDVAAARNAGVAAWAVPYGYNAGRPVAETRPDRLFDTLPEVAAYVLDGARQPAPRGMTRA
ncbi:MAG: phosphoglycolate phosphatase [Pseudomonadota bacterium]